jgi:hypothetical protein
MELITIVIQAFGKADSRHGVINMEKILDLTPQIEIMIVKKIDSFDRQHSEITAAANLCPNSSA